MKIHIDQIIAIPTDLTQPVVATAEALKNCDLSTMPERLKIQLAHGDATLTIEREGGVIKAFCTNQSVHRYELRKGQERSSVLQWHFGLLWDIGAAEPPDVRAHNWTVTPGRILWIANHVDFETLLKEVGESDAIVAAMTKALLDTVPPMLKCDPAECSNAESV